MNRYNFNQYYCDICEKEYANQHSYNVHLRSKTHFEKENVGIKYEGKYKCPICEKVFSDKYKFKNHLILHKLDDSHIKEILKEFGTEARGRGTYRLSKIPNPKMYFCEICKMNFTSKFMDEHLKSSTHLKNAQLQPNIIDLTGDNFESDIQLAPEQPFEELKFDDEVLKQIDELYGINSNIASSPSSPRKRILNYDEISTFRMLPDGYECTVCNMKFNNWDSYIQHANTQYHIDNISRQKMGEFEPTQMLNIEPEVQLQEVDAFSDLPLPYEFNEFTLSPQGSPNMETELYPNSYRNSPLFQ